MNNTGTSMYLEVSEDDVEVAYLYLSKHPGVGKRDVVKKQVCLADLIDDYIGPDVYLDFSHSGQLIGIEVLE